MFERVIMKLIIVIFAIFIMFLCVLVYVPVDNVYQCKFNNNYSACRYMGMQP